jgi:hypothetical protein
VARDVETLDEKGRAMNYFIYQIMRVDDLKYKSYIAKLGKKYILKEILL